MGLFDNPPIEPSEPTGLFGVTGERRTKYKPKAVTAPQTPSGVETARAKAVGKTEEKNLPPIFGLGQGLLKALMTSGAAGIEVFDEAVKGGDKPLTNAAENINTLWGPTDIFEPGAWRDLKTGEDVIRDTFGQKEKLLTVGPGLGIPIGTNYFWQGLGLDIFTDPLTYTPLTILSTPFKVGAAALRATAKGGRLAAAGEVAEKLATRKAGEAVEIFNERPMGVSKKLQREGLQNVQHTIIRSDPAAAATIKAAEKRLANNVYKTVRVSEPRTLSAASRDIVASAVESGVKAATNSYVSVNLARYLGKYAARDISKIPFVGLKTSIARNSDTGRYEVLSGNKVKLGEAETKQGAQKLASNLRKGIETATNIAPATAIAGARKATEEVAEAADELIVPAADGGEVSLQAMVPHQAENGKSYIYDGENVLEFNSVEDANNWVRYSTEETIAKELEPVISGKSGNYQVRVGDSVTRFKTKRDATAYAEGIRTGEIPVGPGATRGGTPILDAAPPVLPVKEALKLPSKAETSALKAVLEGVDDVAKKASGWRPLVNKSVANQIRQALSKTQAQLDTFLVSLPEGILSVLREFLNNDLTAKQLFALLGDLGAKGEQLAKVIETIPIETTKGTITFAEALKKAKGNFLNLSKAIEGVEGAGLEAQVLKIIKSRLYDRAQQLKTKAILPASTPEGKYQAIVAAAGEEIADKIKKTGYLTEPTKANTAKVQNILEEVSIGSSEVSYQGYDDLLEGLRRGDEVSANVIEEIVNLIDPDGAMKASVSQAAAEPASAYLTRLLTREGGVNTIYEAERRLAMAKDPEMLAKHANLAYEAEVVSLIKMSGSSKKALIEELELASTRQNQAQAFSNYPLAVQRDAMDSAGRALMGDPKKAGGGGRFAYKAGILEEAAEGGAVRVSTTGEKIYATGEAYADGSRAMFAKQLQQSDEIRIIGSLLGKAKYREGVKREAVTETGKRFSAMSGEEKLDYLTKRLDAARDGLGGIGFRFVRAKNRDDALFEKAYVAEIKKAKDTKTTPNFSALSEKHTVYLPMGDILGILQSVDQAKAGLIKGFFPSGKVDLKRDVMDWYGLGDAARRVLEMDSANEVFDVNEIAMRILRRGQGREVPSGRRLEIFKEAANEIADVLTQPEIVAQLKAVHMDNAGSIVKDFMRQAEDYSEALFDVLDEAWVTMHAADNLSEAARMNAVRLFFRKFVLSSDIMRLEGGPIAEAMFRASAMLFADGGRVLPAGKISKSLSESEKEFYNLLRQDEMGLFREALTKWYRYADIPTAPIGREGMPIPKKAAQNKAQENLDTVMELYAKHMEELKNVEATSDLTLIKQWEKDMTKIQNRLNKAREDAWQKWVQTYHWHPTEGWVATEAFDHADALRASRNVHAKYMAAKQGVADRELMMADSVPVVPPYRVLNKTEKARFLKKHRAAVTENGINNAGSIVDDISRNVADELDQGMLELDHLGGADKMMITTQNIQARAIKEATEIRIFTTPSSYKDKLPEADVDFNRLYRPLLDEDTPVLLGDRAAVKLKLMAQRWSATTRSGTSDAMIAARAQENKATQFSTDYAGALDKVTRLARRATIEDLDAVWTSLRDDIPLPEGDAAIRFQVRDALAPFTNATLKSELTSVLTTTGLDGAALGKALNRYGLNESFGFPSIDELQGKTAEELVASLFNDLPFGTMPKNLKPGSGEAIRWAKRREAFRSKQLPMPLAFSRMFTAIEQLKAEQGIAHNLAAQFGWKAHFKTFDQAKAAGWVQIEAAGEQSIARFLPDAQNGNLFHPIVAEDIGRVFREWNAIYETKAMPSWLRSSMRFMGFLKFTQTTSRAGHHVVNLVGDGSTMVLSMPVRDWPKLGAYVAQGADIATRFTKANFAADYAKFGKDFEAEAARLPGFFGDIPGAQRPEIGTPTLKLRFYEDGKPGVRELDKEELARDFGNRGIMVPGFVQADIMNSTNDMMLTGTTAGNKRTMSKIWSKVARPGHEVMRGLSTFTAAYSNVIRATTAIRVAESRVWTSYEEMMNAVLKEVNLIHPTVQSLASAEKKWGRLAFTYYTWLRQAHNALFDIAVNRTAATLAIPKIQYNYMQMQGFNPESPAVPFSLQSRPDLPDYASYSVYGPSEMGPQGPRTYRPPLMLLDVLEFWEIYYDPSKPLGENVVQMAKQLGSDVIGPALNILGKPILRAVSDRPGGATTPGQFIEDTVSNLGYYNLAVGLGLHTPYRYTDPDTTNPLTEEDRKLRLSNWLTGARAQDLYRPINIKLGQSQYGSRVKQYNERTQEQNLKNAQQFVDGKLSEGYSKQQIIEMLKEMGAK